MTGPGQIPGQYNLIIEGACDTFEHQIPVKEFLQRLKENNVPEKVSVVGLADALSDEDIATELAREMDQRANDLEYQSPTIQFVVEGSFHRSGKTYDLRYDDELHSLQRVFGPQLDRKESGEWLVAPF
ncbi:hypothetical protein EGH24_12260 [Halonotius terrestris]|uniref:DUF8076 domain-containing protein n=1 Tax=Halonotius terrestris TaxID=2487750 RepID=A0A8J8P883_9EURY|nr:hypothetical protein [Halonotius terrestris]TQQ79160.1 hypothetical protein EGH24_12260 [Halonotius terrestris]